eukprot:scaffold1761_cov357-Prasinococcus_capsulatus_cf.AAC.2
MPQPGNPKPRMFRLTELEGVINRCGFNSDGQEAVAPRVEAFRQTPGEMGVLGINFGKNKATEEAAAWEDYAKGLRRMAHLADYVVINVSSPNTPGLRKLQGKRQLSHLVAQVQQQLAASVTEAGSRPPLLIKIAPDLTDQEKKDIASVAMRRRIDGLIVGNTTMKRSERVLAVAHGNEAGGLSGRPLKDLATEMVFDMYKLTKGKVTIIGCGGISSGADAYEKIRAGASLVQIYTAMAYQGPQLLPDMKKEIEACLQRDGFANISEAIGADHK